MRKGLLTAAVIMLITAVTAFADFDASITDFSLDGGVVTVKVSKTTDAEARGIAAVYDTTGILKKMVMSDTVSGTGDKQLNFKDSIILSDSEIVKVFLWTSENGELTLQPLSDTHTPAGQPTFEPRGDGIIHLLGDSVDAYGVENVTVDGTNVTITAAGEYTVEGTLNDGQLIVNSADKKDKITVNLNGVSITSASGNAIDGQTGKVTLVPVNDSTVKSTADGGTAIYSKHDLTIKGQGSITAVSEGNGIRCKNDIEIGECDLSVTAGNNGIKGDQSVKITKKNRSITIVSGGDGIKSDQLPELDEATGEYTVGGTVTINGGNINITAKTTTNEDGTVSSGEGIQSDTLLTITGGTIDITASGDGIQCETGDVEVTGGDITVNSQQDCMQAENIMNISGGMFDLTAYGGAPNTVSDQNSEAANSCKGVKAGALINISGGTLNINTYDDCVHSNNTVRISGGSITAASGDDGIHGDSYLFISDSANIDITKSYEGIEAAKIYISGGETRLVSADDGANAAGEEPTSAALDLDTAQTASIELFGGPGGNQGGPNWGGEDSSTYGYLEVSGGLLYIEAEGDGFDSNGDGLISGGTVLVNGPTSGGNGVFDIGDNNNKLTVTGGTIIGAGTADMAVTPTSADGSQYYVVTSSSGSGGMTRPGQQGTSSGLSTQSAGKAFRLTDSDGNEIVTYVPSKNYAWVFVTTPDMKSGSYTLSYGGSVSGGSYIGKGNYGLLSGGTYSGTSSVTLNATK